jgi:TorA maturation chaperone TorD
MVPLLILVWLGDTEDEPYDAEFEFLNDSLLPWSYKKLNYCCLPL